LLEAQGFLSLKLFFAKAKKLGVSNKKLLSPVKMKKRTKKTKKEVVSVDLMFWQHPAFKGRDFLPKITTFP
jgi:hypothetical protein